MALWQGSVAAARSREGHMGVLHVEPGCVWDGAPSGSGSSGGGITTPVALLRGRVAVSATHVVCGAQRPAGNGHVERRQLTAGEPSASGPPQGMAMPATCGPAAVLHGVRVAPSGLRTSGGKGSSGTMQRRACTLAGSGSAAQTLASPSFTLHLTPSTRGIRARDTINTRRIINTRVKGT